MSLTSSLIDTFTRHRVASNLAMIMMLLSGLWAVDHINTQLDPTVAWPVVVVRANWVGASAEDVEQLIVSPIEQRLRSLKNLQEMYSTSYNGGAYIRVQFSFEADMTLAQDMVKNAVGQIRNFPANMEPITIARAEDYESIATVLVKSKGNLAELMPHVRDMERELLVRGIDRIDFDGMPQEEIAIQVSTQKLMSLETTLEHLALEVRNRSQNTPAGTIGTGQGSRQLRSLDQKRDIQGFQQMEVAVQQDGKLIRLDDIAEIEKRPKLGSSWLTHEGDAAIQMELYRDPDTDAISSAAILNDWLAERRSGLPEGVEVHVYQEVWVLLKEQLSVILENGFSGLVLVIITLFLFLNFRIGWWVMIGIPVSFLFATLIYFALFNGSINILALITFVMALGIVVDDAIVVGEDAVTLFQAGASAEEAAAGGAKRMFVPVMTSSLTTLAAFVPLLITGGEMGEFIVTLPTVLLCVIIASLIECFLVLPGHLKHSFSHTDRDHPSAFRQWFDSRFYHIRDHYYRPVLDAALKFPGITLIAAVGCVMVAFSLVASQRVGVNFVTGMDLEILEANVEFAATATEQNKQSFMDHLEKTLDETNAEFADKNIYGYVVKRNRANLNEDRKYGVQYGSLAVEFAWEEDRTIPPQTFVDQWQKKVIRLPFVEQLQIGVEGGANNGQPDLSLVLRGKDIPTLKQASEELQEALAGFQGVSNIFDDLPYGRDQIVFSLTPTGKAIGLSTESLGRQLRAGYSGQRVQIFNQNAAELEVMVVLPDVERDDIARLKQFPIRTPSGELVALGMVAELYNRRGIDQINHNNSEMSVVVSASVDPETANTQQILSHLRENALKDILTRYDLSSGLSGVSARNQQIVESMQLGALLTLIFIYLILAWSFSSYTWPLAVMTAIPLGLTGAIVGHWIMGMEIGAMSLLAFFSLTGIVVNDSIVLVSFFRRGLDEGLSVPDAIRDAALSRFRAVILTSVTTVAGLSPLMFETFSLAMYMVPIAITICFGLAFATLLVLLVVPALIVMIESSTSKFHSTLSAMVAPAAEPDSANT